ncbi:hypothetical protein [Rothia aeria]|uniref:hypothetical protein n=1 Tax=Rothia aeria TaxID=172042 RepID=UPI003C79869B
MTGYIGTPARMLPLLWANPAPVKRPTRYAVQEAAVKRWAFVSAPATARRREWTLDMTGTQREMHPVLQLAAGHFGNGPWWLVTDEAAMTNMLTPAQSMLQGIANAGAADTVDGVSAVSVVGGAPVTIADLVPAIPGEPITVSVDASGDTVLTVQPVDAAGRAVGAAKTVHADGNLMQRIHATILAMPAGARGVAISARGYTTLACPQVVWSTEPAAWDVGLGSDSVIIEESSSTHTGFEFYTRDWWRTMSLTIREVG